MGNVSDGMEQPFFTQKIQLGKGSSSKVWRGIERGSGKIVAIKELSKATMEKRGLSDEDIDREMDMMTAVKHRNILEFLGKYEDDISLFLALEYCDGGDFGDKVRERGMEMKELEAAAWFRQICCAIHALHSHGICHRDIKPVNFLVAGSMLKLSDFGLACFIPDGQLLTEKVGTPAFMAPEQITLPKSQGYNCSCDIWAAGVAMYMLMFGGKHPFFMNPHMLDCALLIEGKLEFRVAQGHSYEGRLEIERFSGAARELCTSMVQPDLRKRISAQDALQHQWLSVPDGHARVHRSHTTPIPPHTGDLHLLRGHSVLVSPSTSGHQSKNGYSLATPPPVTQANGNANGYSLTLPTCSPIQPKVLDGITRSPTLQQRQTLPPGINKSPSLQQRATLPQGIFSSQSLHQRTALPQGMPTPPNLQHRAASPGVLGKAPIAQPDALRMNAVFARQTSASPHPAHRSTSHRPAKQVGTIVQPDAVANLPRFVSHTQGVPPILDSCRLPSQSSVRLQTLHSPLHSPRGSLQSNRGSQRHNTLPPNLVY